jgi:phosphoesterase RecJ-like protein
MNEALSGAIQAFEDHLSRHRHYLLGTHVGPDGDGLGSALGLHYLLAARGTESTVVIVDPLPPKFDFMLEGFPPGTLVSFPQEIGEQGLADFDAVVLLDCSEFSRLGSVGESLDLDRLGTVVIDHHLGKGLDADVVIVDRDATATATLIAQMYQEWKIPLALAPARALYVALLTETGSFRFSNTHPGVHRLVADLLEFGLAPHEVYGQLFETKPASAMGLVGYGLAHMATEAEGKVVYTVLDRATFEQYQAIPEDADGLVNQLLALETAEVALLLYEKNPGDVKISFRAKNDADVQVLAAKLGGGGHRKAAGATFQGELAEAKAVAVELAVEAVEKLAS